MPWFACEDQLRYFRPQKADKKGSRTTSTGWVSSFPLSQNAGRVIRLQQCLICLSQPRGPPKIPVPITTVACATALAELQWF